MSFGSTIKLNSGTTMPTIGLGTWQSEPNQVKNAVEIAVKNGYRHLDLARVYGNQEEVGAALKNVIPSVVKREELFITSKLWNNAHQPDQVEKALDETLAQLGLDYLDLYLIHWPVAFPPTSDNNLFPPNSQKKDFVELDTETSIVDTWKAVLALPKSKVKAVGVSNFSNEHIKTIIDATGVAPAANQIEAHPRLPQDELVEFQTSKGIHITAYSPLGNNSEGLPILTENEVVKKIAKAKGSHPDGSPVDPAQVVIAWGVKRGYSVIPKSVTESRIISNFKQVELTDEEYKEITDIIGGKAKRFNIPIKYTPAWDINVFGEPEESKATHKTK